MVIAGQTRRTKRRRVAPLLITSSVAGAVLLVIASPYVMPWLARTRSDWAELSNVGQAYGGIAAVLSGLAVVGVTVSLLFQWRQTRIQQGVALRERHFELLKLAVENPTYAWALSGGQTNDPVPLWACFNLVLSHLWLVWDLGEADATSLRIEAVDFFRNSAAREWWTNHGSKGWRALDLRRSRRYVAFIESCVEEAGQLPHTSVPMPGTPRPAEPWKATVLGAVLGGIAVASGLVIGARIIRGPRGGIRSKGRRGAH